MQNATKTQCEYTNSHRDIAATVNLTSCIDIDSNDSRKDGFQTMNL